MKNGTSNTKDRLKNLQEMIISDPIKLDTTNLHLDPTELPGIEDTKKYVDYTQSKKNNNEFAHQVITNIIETYIKSKKLLDSPRLKDLKQNDIKKYAYLLLMTDIAEANLIQLQEFIDGGDMSKDMFMSVNSASKELRECINGTEKHLDKCEKYWKDYASNYGLENDEEKIVQETEVKEDDSKKRSIINMSDLISNIHAKVEEKKLQDKEDNMRKD